MTALKAYNMQRAMCNVKHAEDSLSTATIMKQPKKLPYKQ
jgi:hypothetical protein